jgi:pyruvate dehydrogenase E1 component
VDADVHHEPGRAGAFLGSIYGAPTVTLGMDQWGHSGSRAQLYDYAGIDVGEIVNAAMLALDLNEE